VETLASTRAMGTNLRTAAAAGERYQAEQMAILHSERG
jgi:hypothetical protein